MPKSIDGYKKSTKRYGGKIRIKKLYCVLSNNEIYEYDIKKGSLPEPKAKAEAMA